jgi:competence protein ComEA
VLIRDRILLGAALLAVVLVTAAAWLAVAPLVTGDGSGGAGSVGIGIGSGPPGPIGSSPAAAASTDHPESELVIDVEGGVRQPGIQRLPAGSRVADAIAAAGGYDESADLALAARTLNLAAVLDDGEQVYVPRTGDASGGSTTGGGAAGTGLVNLNTASESELDALPGIGPVTVGKIVAARSEQPFGSLDELVSRKVLTASQLDKIRDLVVVS